MSEKILEAGRVGGIGEPVDESLPQFGRPDSVPSLPEGELYEVFNYQPETFLPYGRKPLTVVYRYNYPKNPNNREATVIAAYRVYEPDNFHFGIGQTIRIPKGALVSSQGFRKVQKQKNDTKKDNGAFWPGRKEG